MPHDNSFPVIGVLAKITKPLTKQLLKEMDWIILTATMRF
jgi:hypothetical protein